jgi:hypothetical protein
MDSLAGYIATICVGATGQYLSQFLRPRVKINYWLSHGFVYRIPNNQFNPAPVPALPAAHAPAAAPQAGPAHFFLLTQSLTIQNFGREPADRVEIVHTQRPDFFQLNPPLNYVENTAPNGEHTLRVDSLAAKEYFVIQFLCYTHMPALAYIRSAAGHASAMPWMTVRRYPRWVYAAMWLAMLVGAGFSVYWIIKGGIFILRSIGGL